MDVKQEKIGNVILDYTDYPGEDFYSEGSDEDRLLEIVKEHTDKEFNRIIAEERRWSTLYHLSHLRGNIVDFLPIQPNEKVLEVGAGCGAITGVLAKKAKKVTCIELSRKRSLINAYRNRDKDNIEIKVGNFQDVESHLNEKYDYIMLIGVLEYALSYIKDPKPYERFLEILAEHLNTGGRIIIAIENKYGMKYFAGAREDHTGRYFDSIMGYPHGSGVRTFSRDQLARLAVDNGFMYKFYYPYPDYKLPIMIYSDDRLPAVGDFTMNERNFDGERFTAFDEGLAFDESVRDGSFPFFSNSFLLELYKENKVEGFSVRHPIYSKHSNERDVRFRIRTDIAEDGYHKRYVMKFPAASEAVAHLEKMYAAFEKMKEEYVGTNFRPNNCVRKVDANGKLECLEFEYLDGITMADELDRLRKRGRIDDLISVMVKFKETLETIARRDFYITDEFTQIFGETKIPGSHASMGTTNVDMIFTNLAYSEGWNVLDYEWTFDFPIPVDYVLYRSIRYYLEDSADDELKKRDIYGVLGMSEEELKIYERMENSFQRWIAGDNLSLIGMYSIFGGNNIHFEEAIGNARLLVRPERVRLYFDYGKGFSEENTIFVNAERDENNTISFDTKLPEGCVALRIDPGDFSCILKLVSCKLNNNEVEKYLVNGISIRDHVVLYDTADPQIILEYAPGGAELHLSYTLSKISNDFYLPLADEIRNQRARLKVAERSTKKKVKDFLKHEQQVVEVPSSYVEVKGI